MAGETIMASVEHNRPGHIGGLSPKLAIHEIGETTEEQADRHGAGDIIMDPQPFEAVSSREQDQRERDAGGTPVERHAAIPQLAALQGVEDHLGTVEDYIAKAPTPHAAQRHDENNSTHQQP